MKPTIMSNEEYHKHPSISKTQLDIFNANVNGLEWAKNCPVDNEKLKTFDFGDAAHAITLEPERLKTDFFVMPELNMRTNAGKAEYKELVEIHSAKKIITATEMKQLKLMYESVMADPAARNWMERDGVAEGSWFWTDKETGVECRCRPDKDIIDTSVLVDVKTTDTIKKFNFSVDDYRYYVQDPFYCDGVTANGVEKDTFVFLVIQKHIECGRYPVACLTLPQEVIDFGRKQYRKNLQQLAEYRDSGKIKLATELQMHRNFMYKMEGDY